jgi:hypothetical protein
MSETLTTKELDIAIGERVMGWKRVWLCGWSTGSFLGGHYDSPEECAVACAEYGREGLRPVMLWARDGCTFGKGEDWSPSTTWEDAGLVVERLNRMGLSVTVTSYPDPEHEARVQGYLDYFSDGACSRWVEYPPQWAQTVPQAICRAALHVLAALAATETR